MTGPKITSQWPEGSVAKTGIQFFGYSAPTKEHQQKYNVVLHRVLELALEGEIQLLYVDNQIRERHMVVYRFTSEQAYNKYRDELVKLAGDIRRGVWEPHRNEIQYKEWLADLPDTTPTASF